MQHSPLPSPIEERRTGLGRADRWSLFAAALLLCAPTSLRAEWPAWRGPSARGSVDTGSFPERWQSNSLAWKVELPGKGGSTPVVWNDRIFVTVPADGQDSVMAFDLSGRRIWHTKLGAASQAKHRTLGSSCNASPVTDGKSLFAYFRSGHLVALNLDGAVRWTVDVAERFGPENLFWDQGSSPALTENLVLLPRLHGGDSWVAGFAKDTGELRWRQARNFSAPSENDNAYSTPVFFPHRGGSAFLLWAADRLTAHAAADGHVLWTCAGFNPNGVANWPAIASPLVLDGVAFVPVGRDDRPGQARIHAIRLDGEGERTASHRLWQRDDVGVFVTSPAAFDGSLYLLRHRGEVVCLDPKTGRTRWAEALPRGTASYYASPVVANGLLYAAREDGVVFTARVRDRFELLSECPLGERIVASPALANSRLILRGDTHLFCVASR